MVSVIQDRLTPSFSILHGPSLIRGSLPTPSQHSNDILSGTKKKKKKKQPKEKVLGTEIICRGHPRVIRADILGQKLREGARNLGKNSISVQTSMTRTCNVHDSRGRQKHRSDKFRADISLPNLRSQGPALWHCFTYRRSKHIH